METQFGYGRLGIMEVWILDAGVFSSHSLYMSNAEITWTLIIPLGEGGGGTKSREGGGAMKAASCHEFS